MPLRASLRLRQLYQRWSDHAIFVGKLSIALKSWYKEVKQCLANLAELKQADDEVLFVFTRSDDCVSCAGRGS